MIPAVRAWVDLAEADYGAAQREFALTAGPNVPVVCFHAQQRVEKLIKGLLVAHGIDPPKVHDLTLLASLLKTAPSPPELCQSDPDALEPGAVIYRYPGLSVTAKNAQAALAACDRVRAILLPRLQGRGGGT